MTTTAISQQLQARRPNWLPLPLGSTIGNVAIEVDEDDGFSKGEILKFFPHQGYGFVSIKSNAEVYFCLREIDFLGEKADRGYLKEGAKVGYDVSQTSKGLHITKLKIY